MGEKRDWVKRKDAIPGVTAYSLPQEGVQFCHPRQIEAKKILRLFLRDRLDAKQSIVQASIPQGTWDTHRKASVH